MCVSITAHSLETKVERGELRTAEHSGEHHVNETRSGCPAGLEVCAYSHMSPGSSGPSQELGVMLFWAVQAFLLQDHLKD